MDSELELVPGSIIKVDFKNRWDNRLTLYLKYDCLLYVTDSQGGYWKLKGIEVNTGKRRDVKVAMIKKITFHGAREVQ